MHCVECGCAVDRAVNNYSLNNFGSVLCRAHQNWIRSLDAKTTNEAIDLYLYLRECGVPAELEKHDGHKSVDICIEEAKVHIEIDGGHHNYDPKQALRDLKRTYYSFKKGYFTLRIPNSLIRSENIDETVDYIIDVLKVGKKKEARKKRSFLKIFR